MISISQNKTGLYLTHQSYCWWLLPAREGTTSLHGAQCPWPPRQLAWPATTVTAQFANRLGLSNRSERSNTSPALKAVCTSCNLRAKLLMMEYPTSYFNSRSRYLLLIFDSCSADQSNIKTHASCFHNLKQCYTPRTVLISFPCYRCGISPFLENVATNQFVAEISRHPCSNFLPNHHA